MPINQISVNQTPIDQIPIGISLKQCTCFLGLNMMPFYCSTTVTLFLFATIPALFLFKSNSEPLPLSFKYERHD